MRILHVIRGLANSSGTTHIVGPLSEAQARLGCDVSVFHIEKDGEPAVEPDPVLVASRRFPMSLPMSNPGVSWPFARAMDDAVGSFDIVHIHAVWNFATYYAMRSARRAGVPYIVAPQGSFEPWALRQNALWKRIYGALAEVPLLQRASCLQAVTETEREQLRAFGLEAPVVVVPNGIDPAAFERSTAPIAGARLSGGETILLFLSRIHPKKGLDVLVEAFVRIAARRADVTLVIAGDDGGSGYRATVESWIRERGLEDRCRFLGEVRGAEKRDVLLGADAFVLPSRSEGLPVAVIEAMAAGLPVVITAACNMPDVATRDAGYVVGAQPDQVADAVDALFADPARARRLGDNGRSLVAEKFTWPGIARELVDVYGSARASFG